MDICEIDIFSHLYVWDFRIEECCIATDFSFGMFEARKGFVIHSQSAFQSIPMDKGCSVFGKPSP
jgi:hypothetical protein